VQAKTLFEESLVFAREADITHQIAAALLMLSITAVGQKDYERAWNLNAESLALYHQMGSQWGEALILTNNAEIRLAEGRYREARDLARQSLLISQKLNDIRVFSETLEQYAELIALEGEYERSARLMGAAEIMRDSIFAALEPLNHSKHDRLIARLRANLDESAFAAAWAEGRLRTLEQALEDALSEK
jgi:hypothetical protein